mmetsp:Transcript_112859/g.319236  ORF Transcript_112859/g.319236 Transcript_112859/m.319236 type:complete len:235 (-) Transcript_112859:774-1478(-)
MESHHMQIPLENLNAGGSFGTPRGTHFQHHLNGRLTQQLLHQCAVDAVQPVSRVWHPPTKKFNKASGWSRTLQGLTLSPACRCRPPARRRPAPSPAPGACLPAPSRSACSRGRPGPRRSCRRSQSARRRGSPSGGRSGRSRRTRTPAAAPLCRSPSARGAGRRRGRACWAGRPAGRRRAPSDVAGAGGRGSRAAPCGAAAERRSRLRSTIPSPRRWPRCFPHRSSHPQARSGPF